MWDKRQLGSENCLGTAGNLDLGSFWLDFMVLCRSIHSHAVSLASRKKQGRNHTTQAGFDKNEIISFIYILRCSHLIN